jgi:hypothetical protein
VLFVNIYNANLRTDSVLRLVLGANGWVFGLNGLEDGLDGL